MTQKIGAESYLIMASLASESQAGMLKTYEPILSTSRRRIRAKRLMERVAEMGTVLTKVMKDRPLPSEKPMTDVLGSKAFAVTLTSGTYMTAWDQP